MGLAGVNLINRTHRIDVSNLERTVISQKAAEAEKFINEVMGLFQLQVGFKEYAEIELSQQVFLAERMLEENPYLEEVSFIGLDGKETSKATRAGRESKNLKDQGQNPNFLTAKSGADYFGTVKFTSPPAQAGAGPTVTVASPIINREGQIISVLSGEVNLRPIQESVSNVLLGNTGYLYITDPAGSIIAHSRNIDIGKNIKETQIVNDILGGKTRNGLERKDIYTGYWGERVIGAGNLARPLNWAIIVEWPLDDAQQVVAAMVAELARFSFIALLFVFVISSFVALQLTRPISKLKEGAGLIGEGKFDYRIKLRTGDELEELGHSLNKMAESLGGLEELHELRLKTQYLAESLAKEKELSKLKDQFITVASHQLLTPLSVIGWTVEGLRDPSLTREMLKEGVKAVEQSRRDLLAISQDLLTISEIGFGYRKTGGKTVSLEKLVKSAVDKFKSKIAEKKLNLEIKPLSKNTDIDADEFTLEKAVEALVDNAITYSNDGGRIEIELTSDDSEVRFSIKDEGIGIPKDDEPLVFKEFFRAKNAVSKKNVGTGLGLFIVKTIVRGHGGKISFESEENKGATFRFTLPRA